MVEVLECPPGQPWTGHSLILLLRGKLTQYTAGCRPGASAVPLPTPRNTPCCDRMCDATEGCTRSVPHTWQETRFRSWWDSPVPSRMCWYTPGSRWPCICPGMHVIAFVLVTFVCSPTCSNNPIKMFHHQHRIAQAIPRHPCH
jgi:hypothetical protein